MHAGLKALRLEGKGTVVNVSASWNAAAALLLGACDNKSRLAPQSAFEAYEISGATAVQDTFWQSERREEATRPRLQRRQSISLGCIGDAPLANGMMRDSR